MKRIPIVALALLLGIPGATMAADIASGVYQDSASGDGVKLMRQSSGTAFSGVGSAATVEKTFAIGAPAAVLKGVLVTATVCANCDIFIVSASGTGGTNVVFEEANGSSKTVNGVAYTTWIAQAPDVPVLAATITSNEYVVYVRITNNDIAARDVVVSLIWGTR